MYRSRLQKLEEKRNLRKATLLTLGSVGLVAAAIILGIPLLIRMAVFLGDLSASKRPVDKSDIIPPVPPAISLAYEATNSARQEIAGSAESGTVVYLTQGGESRGSVVAADDGVFRFGGVDLQEGDNLFMAVAIDQAGNKSRESAGVNLFYSKGQPKLIVDSPTDRQEVRGDRPAVEIKGEVEAGAKLTVNERTIVVSPGGKFATIFSLIPGENVLVFAATDRAGNRTRKELTVIAIP